MDRSFNPPPWKLVGDTIRDASGGVVISAFNPCNTAVRKMIVESVNAMAALKEAGDKSRESAVEGRRAVKTKPKVLPYVYLDIDAEADGKEFRNREVRVGANCSVFDSTWPTKCPFYRGYMDPPQDGEECVYGRSGECACREVRVEAMRRFKEFVDEFLAKVEGVE